MSSSNALYFNGGSYLFADDNMSPLNVKMEPVSPASSVSSSTNSSYGGGRRKRNASQASLAAAAEAKKLKKYEMDPTNDPAVKNAIAAKANREKHKQEFQKLKTENQELKSQVQAKDKIIAAQQQEKDQLKKQAEQTDRKLQQLQEEYSSFMRMLAFGEQEKQAIAQSTIPMVNTNMTAASNNLDQWADEEVLDVHRPGDQIELQQLSQNTLDQLCATYDNMGHSASFPEMSYEEDFSNDPLMSSIKDQDFMPRTPEEFDLGYRQHDDLDQFENRRARAFTPPGG